MAISLGYIQDTVLCALHLLPQFSFYQKRKLRAREVEKHIYASSISKGQGRYLNAGCVTLGPQMTILISTSLRHDFCGKIQEE